MFQQLLIKYCAPTLAGFKTGNIFNYFSDSTTVHNTIEEYRTILEPLGIHICVLNKKTNNSLIYVYRAKKLAEDFNNPAIVDFLSSYGYDSNNITSAINTLRNRINDCDGFPHEIGVFLSYPLEDIIGFIENCGSNFKCNGYWKVYHNEQSAKEAFSIYRRCTNVYCQLFQNGKNIEQLVAI